MPFIVINEAYRHCKAIAADREGSELIAASYISGWEEDAGVVTAKGGGRKLAADFIAAIAGHRFWDRELVRKVPA